MNKSPLALYIHIPFCKAKCYYCDFLSAPNTEIKINAYIEALLIEIAGYKLLADSYIVTSIFFGGGTPSILDGNKIADIMTAVKDIFEIDVNAEITIECNPGTLTEEKVLVYRQSGINRVSLGLQSANNEELKAIGRIHTYEEFLDSYHMLRNYGFNNINIDLISALPHQTINSYRETLEKVIALNPEHISAYSLIVEAETKMFDMVKESEKQHKNILPLEDEERDMYYLTRSILEEEGYCRYEVSNYAKKGKECRHNSAYWTRQEYLGMGLGASSLMAETRYSNIINLEAYIENIRNNNNIKENIQKLTVKEQMEEFMFLGLRLIKGISTQDFQAKFRIDIEAIYQSQIEEMIEKGLLIKEENIIRLTLKGVDLSNVVMSEFIQ